MADSTARQNDLVQFLRRRDYKLVRELGEGAFGKTVLLHDDQIDEYFVCKKYAPISDRMRHEYFDSFKREIKLLHKVYHENVVRVFNYFLYPEQLTGYILMEHIDGEDVGKYASRMPEAVNEVFVQTILGFAYLERIGVLHRDIRTSNLMVRDDGAVKIIDLGFGKQPQTPEDFDKSITLNWWCDLPEEFRESRYDFRTEVYFVGRLFEKILQENDIQHFKYEGILSRMCERTPSSRVASFDEIHTAIRNDQFTNIDFSDDELHAYRQFAKALRDQITRIESNAECIDDPSRVMLQLTQVYRSCMLERQIPDAAPLIFCFLNGTCYYRKQGMDVELIKGFVRLLQNASEEKRRIILTNLHSTLNAIPRYSHGTITPDDIPF